MDRPKQIELIRWTIEEYSGFSCSIEAAESYLDDFNSICASDETQADRQNEQTKEDFFCKETLYINSEQCEIQCTRCKGISD